MAASPKNFYVRVESPQNGAYSVGPFDIAGGCRVADGAIDWIYKQIGILMAKDPNSVLKKHRWNYQEAGAGIFGEDAIVDIMIEVADYKFEIHSLKNPTRCQVVEEQISPRLESQGNQDSRSF